MSSDEADVRAGRIATGLAGVCVLLVLGGVLSYLVRGAPGREMFDAWLFQNAPVGLSAVIFAMALRSQPGNLSARWLFAASVFGSVHVAAAAVLYARAEAHPGLLEAVRRGEVTLAELPASVVWPLWLLALWVFAAGIPITLGVLYFPNGELPSPRWRPVAWLAGTGMVLGWAAFAWGNRPRSQHVPVLESVPADDRVALTLLAVGLSAIGAAGLLTVASLVKRLRSTDPVQRRRVRPVVITGSLFVAVMVLLWPWQAVWTVVTVPAVLLFFTVLGLGITRGGLFDVEIIVSRAVTVAALSAAITLTYLAVVIGLGGLFGIRANLWLSVAATAVIAVGFEPVRKRVHAAATRLVLGDRPTPYELLADLSNRVARADSTEEVLAEAVRLLVETTGAERAEIRTKFGSVSEFASGAGVTPPRPVMHSAPIAFTGELLGEVRLFATRNDPLPPSDEALLRQVAAMLGPVLRNARLTRDLHDRINDLRESRQRIVTVHDQARRALERDIHDGAQQNLLSLRIRLGLAATMAEQDGSAAGTIEALSTAAAEAEAAIAQLRDIARGLFPPMLAEQGVVEALRTHALSAPVQVEVVAPELGRLSADVEAAIYFCCLEAIHNACKHAHPSRIRIDIGSSEQVVRFTVADDGTGFDTATAPRGTGLTNMRDRVDGLGGSVSVDSTPGGGTVVRAELPLG
ncbi:sensor histidine kinase [Nocardioides limicola]|uniref:sensor histidine kinase n=1 Tax=Nocardioides limicola TaxID=2803368 RepID=UPI00193C0C9A|nr:ATP-binding protein [Nocardioides sp. DJM-14]